MTTALASEDVGRVLALAEPSATIARWSVVPDPYPVLTPSTEALARVVATTADGREVRVFVKTLRSLRHWPMIGLIPEGAREASIARFPWRTEADVYGSSLVRGLPDGLRAPRIHAIDDLGDDRLRIWMEDLPITSATWDTPRYVAAARCLGRLAGRSARQGLPADAPPLSGGLRMVWEMRISGGILPSLRNDETWRHPLMAAAERSDPALRRDLLDLADEAPAILDALDRLPRALAHGDACPQNLLPDPERPHAFVAIDWGFAALAPLGTDLGQLLVGLVENGDARVDDMPAIHDAIVPAYLDGLREEGVDLDPAVVRSGLDGGLLVGKTFSALPLERLGAPPGAAVEASFAERARYARYLLDLREAFATDDRPGGTSRTAQAAAASEPPVAEAR